MSKSAYLMRVCNSFRDGRCRERLKYYIERSIDKHRLTVELSPCPFYSEDRACSLERGEIGMHMRGYPAELKIYEKRGDKIIELARPIEILSFKK